VKLHSTTVDALTLTLWGVAAGVWLWASGLDIALQSWLYTNYNQTFNEKMRLLSQLSLGRSQLIALLGLGAAAVLWQGGLHGLIQALNLTARQWVQWLRGKSGWLKAWAEIPTLTRFAFTAIGVLTVSGLAQIILKFIIGRPRPKEWLWNGTDPYTWAPFGFDATFWSLPSGHATSTFAIFVWLAFGFPRWRIPLLLAAFMLSCSRFLAVTPHYLGDVVAGAALGTAVAWWVWGRARG
jgi:membrane-associated phospholipid phosphatase